MRKRAALLILRGHRVNPVLLKRDQRDLLKFRTKFFKRRKHDLLSLLEAKLALIAAERRVSVVIIQRVVA